MTVFQLLNLLGLLGLLGILALIIIYIIKPNYQLKFVSSTYVWHLSMKYRKRRLPTSRLRNILIFICQVLILTLITSILTMPVLVHKNATDSSDVVAIIDSSASMYAGNGGDIRFDRAVEEVMDLADSTIDAGGYVSVILADNKPRFLGRRVGATKKSDLMDSLRSLLENETACYYGSSDIPGAISLSEEILAENPNATVSLFTDKTFAYETEGLDVQNVSLPDEWNVAILDASAEIDDAYYQLKIDIASYGVSLPVEVKIDIMGANAYDASSTGQRITITRTVDCVSDRTKTMIFQYGSGSSEVDDVVYFDLGISERFSSFQSIHVSIEQDDSFTVDNIFDIYGGQKEVLKVQYTSTAPNVFFTGALLTLRKVMSSRWDIQITDVRVGDEPASEGFDLYIYEHKMPQLLPTDGIVFLVDPDIAPTGVGFSMGGVNDLVGNSVSLTQGEDHPLLRNIVADNITVSKYDILFLEEPYDILMSCDRNPVVISKKEGNTQIVVMSFSLHYSNIAIKSDFVLFLYNMFGYFLPSTVLDNAFEIDETITLNARGPELNFKGVGIDEQINEFPKELSLSIPGTYTITQRDYFDKELLPVNIFVKIPREESAINAVVDPLMPPSRDLSNNEWVDDLLVYFAAVLLALIFIEWILQAKENK